MKKILAVILASLMIFSSFTAFADDFDDLYEIIEKTTANSKMVYTVSFELNDTLDFLKTYKFPYMEFIDTYHLTEDLFNSSSEINAKIISSNNLKKADMYMDITFDAPITVNSDLKLGVWGKMYYWITYDFTDEFNPVLKYVMKLPTSDKYQVLDCSKNSEMTEMLTAVNYGEIIDTSKELLRKYSTVKKTKDGYTINITSENAKLFMFDILDNVSGAYGNEFVEIMDVADPFEEIKEYLDENNIFGDEGITANYNIDKKGNIYKGTETIDLLVPLTIYNFETDEETTETIKCKVYTDYKCEKDGNLISIDFPELTEENSIDLLDPNGGYEPNDYMYVYFEGVPYVESDITYYPLRPVLGEYNVDYDKIVWDNGVITVTSEDEYTGFSELKLSAGNDEVIKDGESFVVKDGVIEHNDITYISEEFINNVLDSEIIYYSTNYYEDRSANTNIDLTRKSFTHTLDIDNSYEDDSVYVPKYISIDGGGKKDDVIIRNDTHYFNIDTLLKDCNLSESDIAVYENSTYVKYGEKEVALSRPVIKENNILYVPSDFIYEVLGYEIDYVGSEYYSISYLNPDYVPKQEYFSFDDYGYPYSDGEMYIPYNLFVKNTGAEVDWSVVIYHNGKDYIPLSYITDNLGYQLDYIGFYFEDFTPYSYYEFIK